MQDGGSSIMKPSKSIHNVRKKIADARGKIPIYEIQPNGKIVQKWENPGAKENRAYDLEQNSQYQIFAKGYANPVDIDIPESIDDSEVKLIPSARYQTYMNQKVLQDAMTAGSDVMNQVKYLTIANLVMIVVAVLIGVSLAT